jgi:hypothetical protein
MIRLTDQKTRVPHWLDLVMGVSVYVRPPTTAIRNAALAKGKRLVRETLDHQRGIEAAGGTVNGMIDLTDPDNVAGLSQQFYATALGCAAIMEWKGVLPPEGDEISPITEETIGDLMSIGPISDDFLVKYLWPNDMVQLEGNLSGPAPRGTSAAGPDTAKGARKPARAARKARASKRPRA